MARPLGPLHDQPSRRHADRLRHRAADPGRAGAGDAARHRRCVDGAEELDDTEGVRPPGAGLRPGLQRPDSGRGRPERRRPGGAEGVRRREGAAEVRRRVRPEADPERQEGRRPRHDLPDDGAAGGRDGRSDQRAPQDHRPGRPQRQRGAGLRERPERRVHRHRRAHPLADAMVPAVHHRRHVHRAGDGVPVGRDRDQGRDHDADLGDRRVRRTDVGREDGQRHRA